LVKPNKKPSLGKKPNKKPKREHSNDQIEHLTANQQKLAHRSNQYFEVTSQ
jgi:hypothetical protein